MPIERGPRGPIIPGPPDRDLTSLVNQLLQEGPEFLDLEWLDLVPLDSDDARDMYFFFDGKTAVNVLQGAILSPLFDRILQKAPSRKPFGLIYDESRNLGYDKRYGTYRRVESFVEPRSNAGKALDPYEQLYLCLNDTLEQSHELHLTSLSEKKERGCEEPLVQSLHRLKQLDIVINSMPDRVLGAFEQMHGGIGSGASTTAVVTKVIPLLLDKYGVAGIEDPSSLPIALQTAENTTGTVAKLAMLDNHSFVTILPLRLQPILHNFTSDMLDYFMLRELGKKGYGVELSDMAKQEIVNLYIKGQAAEIPRTGCPFRAVVHHERQGKAVSSAGVVDLWEFAQPARKAIYTSLYQGEQIAA